MEVLCALCLIMDGFDVQAIGHVAPKLIEEWRISGTLLGSVLSAAGQVVGYVLGHGRRRYGKYSGRGGSGG